MTLLHDNYYYMYDPQSHVLTLEMYLEALDKAVEKQFAERKELSRE